MKKLSNSEVANYLRHGLAQQQAGNKVKANRIFQTVLASHPRNADALQLSGAIALQSGQVDDAIKMMEKANKYRPGSAMIQHSLAAAYFQKHDYDRAEKIASRVVRKSPKMANAWILFAQCFENMADGERALEIATKGSAENPKSDQLKLLSARYNIQLGNMQAARAILEPLISSGSSVEAAALIELSSTMKFAEDDPYGIRLKSLAQQGIDEGEPSIHLCYAAAKVLDSQERYDDVFEVLFAVKPFEKKVFDPTLNNKFSDAITTPFTPALIHEKSKLGSKSARPIFIVGMPRSGSTMIEQICARHSRVASAGEISTIMQIAKKLEAQDLNPEVFAQNVRDLSERGIENSANLHLKRLSQASADADYVIDKTPNSYALLGLINILFPNAKIIHAHRNPLDCCVSIYTNRFAQAYAYTADLKALGMYYRSYVELMSNWKERITLPILDVGYETMVNDMDAGVHRILDFLDLEWEEDCLSFSDGNQNIRTLSQWQVRQPVYKSSIGRWKNYRKHLGPLIDALGPLALEN